MMYELVRDETGRVSGVKQTAPTVPPLVSFVPRDTRNMDWQEFLAWNAAQPVPWDLDSVVAPPPSTDWMYIFDAVLATCATIRILYWAKLNSNQQAAFNSYTQTTLWNYWIAGTGGPVPIPPNLPVQIQRLLLLKLNY